MINLNKCIIIAILVFFLLKILNYIMQNTKQRTENFASQTVAKVEGTKKVITIEDAAENNKKIQLKCTFHGEPYVLHLEQVTTCGVDPKDTNECLGNVAIIVEENKSEKLETEHKLEMEDKQKLCEMSEKLECIRNAKKSESSESECSNKKSSACKKAINHVSHFFAKHTGTGHADNTIKTYRLTGFPDHPQNPNDTMPFVLGYRNIPGDVNLLCADVRESIMLEKDKIHDIEFIPTKNGQDNKYKLRYQKDSLSPSGGKLYKNDKLVTYSAYIGVCTDKKCTNDTGKEYRLCLYDNEDSPNVLEFEIQTV